MKNYRIQTLENISDEHTKIIDDYWQHVDGEFEFNLAQLSLKYDLKPLEITKIITQFSNCYIDEICIECGKEFERKIATKGKFKMAKHLCICSACEMERRSREESERLAALEEYIINEESKQRQKEEKFQKAINEKSWLQLNDLELEILLFIAKFHDLRQVKKSLFKDNFYDPEMWRFINHMTSLNLIHIERGPNNSVLSFEAAPDIENYIEVPEATNTSNALSFSLIKKLLRRSAQTPHYSGTFTLEKDVILKAGVTYRSSGWIQTDQSINLKITPENEINYGTQKTEGEEETPSIKEIISKMNERNFDIE